MCVVMYGFMVSVLKDRSQIMAKFTPQQLEAEAWEEKPVLDPFQDYAHRLIKIPEHNPFEELVTRRGISADRFNKRMWKMRDTNSFWNLGDGSTYNDMYLFML